MIVPAFLDRFCCCAVDLPGHGETIVTGGNDCYTMPQTAIALVHLLDRLKVAQAALVGYSMGGRLALYLALHFPQRFPAAVLESASPGLATALEQQERLQRDRALANQLEADFPTFLEQWYNQPLFRSLRQHPKFADVWARRSRNRPAELAKSLRYLSTGQQPCLWERLPHHQQPLLLLVGEHDRKFHQINQAMVAQCPSAQLQVVANCGHVVHLERPETWVECVKSFLC